MHIRLSVKVERSPRKPLSVGNLWFYDDALRILCPDYEALHLQNLIVRIRCRKYKASITLKSDFLYRQICLMSSWGFGNRNPDTNIHFRRNRKKMHSINI